MSIEPAFKEVLVRRFILDQLLAGETPTGADIEAYLEEFVRTEHPAGFTVPLTGVMELSVPTHSAGSASAHNEFLSKVEIDDETINTATFDSLRSSLDSYDRWSIALDELRTRASNLRDRLDALLLLRSDTEGYFDSFNEDFFTTQYLDLEESTASVDIADGKVTINLSRPDTPLAIYKIDTNRLTNEDITIRVLDSRGFVGLQEVDTLPITNLVKDITSGYSAAVTTTSGVSGVTLELVIRLSRTSSLSVNRIKVDLSSASISGGLIFTASYSDDGSNWTLIPGEFHTKKITIKDDFAFSTVRAKYFRFVILNEAPDIYAHSRYIYDFSMRNIHFYNERYDSDSVSLVQSKEIFFKDSGGNERSFSKATLEVCEELMEDTDISYELRGYDSGESEYTSWIPICPFNREEITGNTIVQFSSENIKDSTSGSVSTILNLTRDVRSLNYERLDTDGNTLAVAFEREELAPLNFYIGAGDLNDMVELSLLVQRNIGIKDQKFPLVPEDLTVRNVSSGWRESEDGTAYETYINVLSEDGWVLELGGSIARLNGVRITGRTVVPKGIHLFSTQKFNWLSLSGASPATLEELRELDTLYPVNHKYLIEGFQYPLVWDAEKVYIGVDSYFAVLCRRIPALDIRLTHDTEDLSVVGLERLDQDTNGSRGIFLVNYDATYSDFSNELFRVEYKTKDSAVDRLQWRATLSSESSEKTPVLSFVRVKIG